MPSAGKCFPSKTPGEVQRPKEQRHRPMEHSPSPSNAVVWLCPKKTAGAADENQNKNVITNENSQFSSPTLCLKPDDDANIGVCFFHRPWLVPQIPAGSSRLLARSIYLKQYDKWKIARWIETIQNLGRI